MSRKRASWVFALCLLACAVWHCAEARGEIWEEEAKLLVGDGAADDSFGYSVSILAYVRAYTRVGQDRLLAPIACAAVHVALLVGLAILSVVGWLPPWWWRQRVAGGRGSIACCGDSCPLPSRRGSSGVCWALRGFRWGCWLPWCFLGGTWAALPYCS